MPRTKNSGKALKDKPEFFLSQDGQGRLSAKVIEHQVLSRNTEVVEHLLNSFRHRAGTTHVVFDVFGSFVVFQVSLVNYVVYEARSVLHARCIGCRIGTVQCKMELEVGEILFYLQEVFQVEHLVESTRAVEVVHHTVGCVQRLREVHNLRTQRSHANLSTGMKQKASLAISLVHDPDIVIFDEPTNGLDVLTARVVTDFLLQLKTEGKTVIVSTHIFSLIERICDRVGIIINGTMIECGTLAEICAGKSLEDRFFDLYQEHVDREETTISGKERA